MLLVGSGAFLASLRVDWQVQGAVSLALLAALIGIKRIRENDYLRSLFLVLSSFIVLRYFFWRLNYTLGYQDLLSFIGAISLFAAEIYGGIMFFLTVFVNIRPHRRRYTPLPTDTDAWPSVDVVIPSYDEPADLVKITLAAARNIDYPKHKLRIYLLDDGATEQKLTAEDPLARHAAINRQRQFLSICNELDVRYLAREKNEHAKAGNLNAALPHLGGDLILVLDADHAPCQDILTKTAGAFIEDEKLFLVQTPHFFINPDPIEKNLDLFHRMPPENYMFYQGVQLGLDFWQSSFFCGSAAVLRRKAIDEVGGFCGVTITEDSETALLLHSRGWRSHYIDLPLIAGLQPETFASFMKQRIRWAQGMVQNFIFHNPLLLPDLKIWQRMGYLSNMLFWFFPFARLFFLISPALFLFFGLKIYNANFFDFLSYTVPYLTALLLTNHYLFSKLRWAFVSEIYEIMQSLFSIKAVWATIKNPAHPTFSVTPKNETLAEDFISPLAGPFYWTIAAVFASVCVGFWRFFYSPDERDLVAITLLWAIVNFILLLSALGALFERKQRRANPRIPVHIEAHWLNQTSKNEIDDRTPVIIKDLSIGGSSLYSSTQLNSVEDASSSFILIADQSATEECLYKATITNTYQIPGGYIYGIKFVYETTEEFLNIVKFVHGDSSKWTSIQDTVSKDPGLLKSMIFMTKVGMSRGIIHLKRAIFQTKKKKKYHVNLKNHHSLASDTAGFRRRFLPSFRRTQLNLAHQPLHERTRTNRH